MGQKPAEIKRQMSDTRGSIEKTLSALKTSTDATKSDLANSVALTVDDLGTRAGDATQALASRMPTMENAMPLVIASLIVGFAAGFSAPLLDFERTRLRPAGDELLRRTREAQRNFIAKTTAT